MRMPANATYEARLAQIDGVEVVKLSGPSGVWVSIAPRLGNNAFEFVVNGKNSFWFPYSSVGDFAAAPDLCGNPFLAPWANRLDEDAFYAGGIRYELNRGLDNYLRDQDGQPIHGLLLFADEWEVAEVRAGAESASVTSRLDFSRYPRLMAQFPFAHCIAMTYRLSGTSLHVRTVVENTGAEPMPVSVGFHPYFQLHDSARDSWNVRIAARSVWDLNERFTPSGTQSPIESNLPIDGELPLRGQFLYHVFGDLERDRDGWARFRVRGARERLSVAYGPGYSTAVVYAPTGEGQSFICFEPMSGITNAFNLAHRGRYKELPEIRPGGSWQGTYRIEVEEF